MAAVFLEVSSHVQQLGGQHLHPVFLFDEARLLHQDVLDHLHIFANYQWDSLAPLSILLVGLPEMQDRLQLRKNRSLWSRIHTRLHLGEATSSGTADYVAHRLRALGANSHSSPPTLSLCCTKPLQVACAILTTSPQRRSNVPPSVSSKP